jgi:hypothetical protein
MLCMSIFKLAVGCVVLLFGKHFLSITSFLFHVKDICGMPSYTKCIKQASLSLNPQKKLCKRSCKCEVFVQSLILFSNMAFKRILFDMLFDSLYYAFTQLPFMIFVSWMHGQFDAFSGHMKVVNNMHTLHYNLERQICLEENYGTATFVGCRCLSNSCPCQVKELMCVKATWLDFCYTTWAKWNFI